MGNRVLNNMKIITKNERHRFFKDLFLFKNRSF